MPSEEQFSEQVNESLTALLTDDRFKSSPQMSAFLAYIVEETLNGRADRIKAYTIAVDALGKPETFDPQANPSVRVLAKRLRDTLTQYYDAKPKTQRIKIKLLPGSYVPQFEEVSAIAMTASKEKLPSSVKLPVSRLSTNLKTPLTSFPQLVAKNVFKYHRQATLAGVMLMAVAAWQLSPSPSSSTGTEKFAHHDGETSNAKELVSIDIAILENINIDQERPPIPSITITTDLPQNSNRREISHLIQQSLSTYGNVMVHSDDGKTPRNNKSWPEEYILHYSSSEHPLVEMQVSHALSGKIIQRGEITLSNDVLRMESVRELQTFSQQLLKTDGTLLIDYKQRDQLTPTMHCTFLFDQYYANKTRQNQMAARDCASQLQQAQTVSKLPELL